MSATRTMLLGSAAAWMLVVACSSETKTTPDAGSAAPDGASPVDAASSVDARVADTSSPLDAGLVDAVDASTCGFSPTVQSAQCTACLLSNCCLETANCLGDAPCKSLDDCAAACIASNGGDAGSIAACAQRCNDQAAAPVRVAWRAYNDCLNFRCVKNGAGPCQ